MQEILWDKTSIEEMDIRATELDSNTIISILTRLTHLRWLDASWLENFTDEVSVYFWFFINYILRVENVIKLISFS